MLRPFRADLHVHTCLSPCAELDMTPRQIVDAARGKGLDILAITDHNSAENTEAARRAAVGSGMVILSGMEITSSEEVHVLALFDNDEGVMRMQDVVYGNLPPQENDERLYGQQVIVNEFDEVMGFNTRLLITATGLHLQTLVAMVHSCGGLCVASHVDREAFSIISQLGFVPGDAGFDALEFSSRMKKEQAEALFGHLKSFPWVSSSDAHYIADVGGRTVTFTMEEPTLEEIRLALRDADGRRTDWP